MFGVLYAIDDAAGDALDSIASPARDALANIASPARDALANIAREFSPRIERHGDGEVSLDLNGLARLFGDARVIGGELQRTARERGIEVCVAIAGTRTAARLLARAAAPRPSGIVVIEPGTEADALARLPLGVLAHVSGDSGGVDPASSGKDTAVVLRRWGLTTLGDLAALPAGAVAARLGQQGVRWQRLARGEDLQPLVPAVPEERFEDSLALDWPIEGLEPLSFVVGRLMDAVCAQLARRGRGAAVLHLRLALVTRDVHERALQLPVPMNDPRTLRTLALLDLESHPPVAAIDRVTVTVDPAPARTVQFSLLARPLPSPEQLSTLNARLAALMGEGRCGSPVLVDSWEPGAFAMKTFAPPAQPTPTLPTPPILPTPLTGPVSAFRRFRHPVPARVRLDVDRPRRVMTDSRGMSGGEVETCAGPWRTSGAWWGIPDVREWDRDEWDVTLSDGITYRIFRERHTDAWFVEGTVD